MSYLTKREAQCLGVIADFNSRGVGPSYRDLCAALGVSSTSVVARIIGQLERKRAIRRMPGRSCALEAVLVQQPPFPWPESRRRTLGTAHADNFAVVTGRAAWTSFQAWYSSHYGIGARLAGRAGQ